MKGLGHTRAFPLDGPNIGLHQDAPDPRAALVSFLLMLFRLGESNRERLIFIVALEPHHHAHTLILRYYGRWAALPRCRSCMSARDGRSMKGGSGGGWSGQMGLALASARVVASKKRHVCLHPQEVHDVQIR